MQYVMVRIRRDFGYGLDIMIKIYEKQLIFVIFYAIMNKIISGGLLMSFFNKLRGTINKLGDVLEKTADSIQRPSSAQQTYYAPPPVTPNAPVRTYHTSDSYFSSLIVPENFPGYTITANVHARNFDPCAHPSCYPISYLLANASGPVLAVLVMNTNQYRSMIAKGTYSVLNANGIPYIRFFRSMENERSYVLNRIRENLR